MSVGDTVFVDYAQAPRVAGMRVCGMTVVERVLRQAAQAGAARAIVRGDALPALPPLPLAVETIPATAAVPEARAIGGDVVAGVTITDEATRKRASRALLQTCRRAYDGLGDKYVIRGFSLPLSAVFCRLGVTPNQITWTNVVVGLVACAFAAVGTRLGFALAGGLMFVQAVLDSCDGEVARLRYLSSKFGMWLDNTSDDLIDNLFIAMLGVGIGGIWLPIGVGAAIAKSLTALMIHIDVARRGKAGDIMAFKWFFDTAGEELAERFDTGTSISGIGRALGRRDAYILMWTITCAAGVPVVGLLHGVIVAVGYFGLAVAHVIVTRRSSASADRA
jgi:phosphatidylglycerophosphate synthase